MKVKGKAALANQDWENRGAEDEEVNAFDLRK